jgi:hypothetical protein
MLDQVLDFLQRSMTVSVIRVMVMMLVLVSRTMMMVVIVRVRMGVFLMLLTAAAIDDLNMIRADTSAQDPRDPNLVVDPQRSEGRTKCVERHTSIQQCAEHHVASGTGKAVEIHHARHQSRPVSRTE